MLKIKVKLRERIRQQIHNILVQLVSLTGQYIIVKMVEVSAKEVGISITSQLYKEGFAVLMEESRLNPKAKCYNKDWHTYLDGSKRSSIDNGIAQFNDYWYWDREKVISPKDALNPKKALRVFWVYFPKRKTNWTSFKTGAYKKHMTTN